MGHNSLGLRIFPLVFLLVSFGSSVGCSKSSEATTGPDDSRPDVMLPDGAVMSDEEPVGLPCEVGEATRTCRGCHASEPQFGAPMPLVTHDDFHAMAETDPSLQVFELAHRRINDEEDPMPPAPFDLSDAEHTVLDAWLAEGAPLALPEQACDSPPVVEPPPVDGLGPDALPCEPSHTFTAHAPGSETDGYDLQVADDGNRHVCFAFRSPLRGKQAIAYAPILDNTAVLHHYIMWGSNSPPPNGEDVFECETLPDAQSAFLMGWAPGQQNRVLPEDVGLELEHEWLYLQIHYYNPRGIETAPDKSGIAVCTVDEPRENVAGVLAVGDIELNIPGRAREHMEEYTCPELVFNFVGEMTILGSSPHMHGLGRKFYSDIMHADGTTTPVSSTDAFDYNNQQQYVHRPALNVRQGDSIRVQCIYDNPNEDMVNFGENTQDEMCFDFMLVYPIDQWPAWAPRFCANIDRFLGGGGLP